MPNAWPSASMISNSLFLQQATQRHPFSYITRVFAVSPLHTIGLLFGLFLLLKGIFYTITRLSRYSVSGEESPSRPSHSVRRLALLSVWPLAFLGGLTLIGVLGGGYQTRFVLPVLPATAILAGVAIQKGGSQITPLVSLLLCYSALHVMYYGVLFTPLVADFNESIFEIMALIVTSVENVNSDREFMMKMLKYMKHFGLNAL
jgi:hypothetical protein